MPTRKLRDTTTISPCWESTCVSYSLAEPPINPPPCTQTITGLSFPVKADVVMFRNRQSSLIFPGTKGRKESSLSFCIDRFGKWVPSNTSRQPEDFIGAKNRCEPVGGSPYRRPRNDSTPPLSKPRILPRRVDKTRINYVLKNFL